jgi:3-dehydroquinate synthase
VYSQINVKSKLKDYSIKFEDLSHIIRLSNLPNTITIIDSNVAHYFPQIGYGFTISVDTNENLKTWDGVKVIFDELLTVKANINTKLLVIGGGVLQDAVGFCASVFCRGIDYILVPTTLLSQIDSCVGGKTSINYGSRKNILGTFYPPTEIIICEEFLQGLSQENFCSGLGELFKFDILRNKISISEIDKLITRNHSVIEHINESLLYKISILEIDEFDKLERKFLNFGHTFGHALEITSNYKLSHGYAVVVGCLVALEVSKSLFGNHIDTNTLEIANNLLSQTCPIEQDWFDFDNLMECVKSDKKNTGCVNMVLIKDGQPVIQKIEDYSIIKRALENTYEAIRLCN